MPPDAPGEGPFAHSLPGRPRREWQPLAAHLEAVAALAERFAAPFGAAEWARLAGLWHDLGKYNPAFQRYLETGDAARGPDHSSAGALLARERAGKSRPWLPLGLVIAGHHGGLANLQSDEQGGPKPLLPRLAATQATIPREAPNDLVQQPLPELPSRFGPRPPGLEELERQRRGLELWTRFLFSALVDADFLDTEAFCEPETRAAARAAATSGFATIAELRQRLDRHLDGLASRAPDSAVNRVRAEVLGWCRAAAPEAPGFFSLSVPTGGGKTFSSLAFALAHAERHGLERVIVAIPFTTILDQTVDNFRQALGAEQVIEHHSSLDPEQESTRNRLASENWDAPVVVTTNVQLFESLFANRTSRCRKLHNVARSVIVLDEAQNLPPEFLLAILDGLAELVRHYGCTVLFSTATQPALRRREGFEAGLSAMREIVPDPAELARRLRRYHVAWPTPGAPATTWDELAAELLQNRQVLAVVHRRLDARELASRLPEEGLFHLSALLCGAHRREVLARVRQALASEAPCRLVSTQLIEAGVDVDFPTVYRALGGLDSLLQAGGRANREGKQETGTLHVFLAPTAPPPGVPKRGFEAMSQLMAELGQDLDPFDPATVERYFRQLYHASKLDEKAVQADRAELSFANVARKFQLIEDGWSAPLVVPYGEGPGRLEALRAQGPDRQRLRALQPFLVNVARWHLEQLEAQGAVERVHELVWALTFPFHHVYDRERYGLIVEEEPPKADASSLYI